MPNKFKKTVGDRIEIHVHCCGNINGVVATENSLTVHLKVKN